MKGVKGFQIKPIDPALRGRVATLKALGKTNDQIIEETGLSKFVVQKVLRSPESQALIKAVDETFINSQLMLLKTELARLINKAVKVIEKNLDENNLEAVKVLFKGVGAEAKVESGESNQNITVIMPGVKTEKIVEVTDETNQ